MTLYIDNNCSHPSYHLQWSVSQSVHRLLACNQSHASRPVHITHHFLLVSRSHPPRLSVSSLLTLASIINFQNLIFNIFRGQEQSSLSDTITIHTYTDTAQVTHPHRQKVTLFVLNPERNENASSTYIITFKGTCSFLKNL